jgi:hypothetical protein
MVSDALKQNVLEAPPKALQEIAAHHMKEGLSILLNGGA